MNSKNELLRMIHAGDPSEETSSLKFIIHFAQFYNKTEFAKYMMNSGFELKITRCCYHM